MVKCLVMFSGGLDSTIAVHLLKSKGFDVLALHFVLPFYSEVGQSHDGIKKKAEKLGVPVRVIEEGEEYLAMFKDPHFGFGKNINPCIDCRIHRLKQAACIMQEEGFAFIATGEVVGQRPMSQHKEALNAIEKRAGLRGYLLRPLSAGLLAPTIPEEQGTVDRSALFSWWGRGRKPQFAYAHEHGLDIASPAGGCLLTHEGTALRYAELQKNNPNFSLSDFKLIAFGRHFRFASGARLVVARIDEENVALEKLLGPDDYFLMMTDVLGPLGLLRGEIAPGEIEKACAIVARYSKARMQPQVNISVVRRQTASIFNVPPATDAECSACRI